MFRGEGGARETGGRGGGGGGGGGGGVRTLTCGGTMERGQGGGREGTFVVRSQKSEIVSYSCFPEKKYKHETF